MSIFSEIHHQQYFIQIICDGFWHTFILCFKHNEESKIRIRIFVYPAYFEINQYIYRIWNVLVIFLECIGIVTYTEITMIVRTLRNQLSI